MLDIEFDVEQTGFRERFPEIYAVVMAGRAARIPAELVIGDAIEVEIHTDEGAVAHIAGTLDAASTTSDGNPRLQISAQHVEMERHTVTTLAEVTRLRRRRRQR